MSVSTKHCSQCGLVATTNSAFCVQCGVQFPPAISEPSSYICEECDALLPDGSRYCPCCGVAFDTPVPAAKPDAAPNFQQPPRFHKRTLSKNGLTSGTPAPPAPMLGGSNQPATTGLHSLDRLKATKGSILVAGTLLAIIFFAAGFGLIQLAHPQVTTVNADNALNAAPPGQVSEAGPPPTPVIPAYKSPASAPLAVQHDNNPSSDEAVVPTPQAIDPPDLAPKVSSNGDHAASNADDTMTAYAPQGSGLSDVPLSTDTLQNEAVTSDDLKPLSLRALSISHNSIYALHGYIFSRPAIQAYFKAQDWYHPDPAFYPSMLTRTEQQNVQAIRAAERANFSYGRNSFDEQGRSYEQRDPLRENAAPGSGLDDTLLDLNTLQHTILTSQDLSGKSLAALSISYNAIYAAHGYVFKRASLQQVFGHTAWYHPNSAFQETDLTTTEKANLQTIRHYEHSRFGY